MHASMQQLTLQVYHQGVWQDAARLSFQQPELGSAGRCNFAYQSECLADHPAQEFLTLPDILTDLGLPAVTMNHPRIAPAQLPKRLAEWGLL